MKIERYDMIVIGAGPAGLSAAIEAAKKGLKPIVFDENAKPVDSFLNRYINFSVQRNTKLKSEDLRLVRSFLVKLRNTVLRLS